LALLGSAWLCLALLGSAWLCLALLGSAWLCFALFGSAGLGSACLHNTVYFLLKVEMETYLKVRTKQEAKSLSLEEIMKKAPKERIKLLAAMTKEKEDEENKKQSANKGVKSRKSTLESLILETKKAKKELVRNQPGTKKDEEEKEKQSANKEVKSRKNTLESLILETEEAHTVVLSHLPGSARLCPALPGSARLCPALPGSARLCPVLPGSARLCPALPRLCPALPGTLLNFFIEEQDGNGLGR
jgi:hypothetical protein